MSVLDLSVLELLTLAGIAGVAVWGGLRMALPNDPPDDPPSRPPLSQVQARLAAYVVPSRHTPYEGSADDPYVDDPYVDDPHSVEAHYEGAYEEGAVEAMVYDLALQDERRQALVEVLKGRR